MDIFEDKKAEIRRIFDLLRPYLTYPQSDDTYVYIIDRKQLQGTDKVTAKQLKIEREFAHFLTDYENPNNKITIHAALNTATDPAEFLHDNDTSVYEGEDENLQSMAGMLNDGLAVNRPGFYIIDGETAELEQEDIFEDASDDDLQKTWYLGLYAYRDQKPTRQFEDIYWLSFGAWTNILSEFVYDMYEDYKYRQKPLEEILTETKSGVPVALSRVHINRSSEGNKVLSIADSYEFPHGYFASSPQFVPSAGSTGATEGYIVCTVIHSDNYSSKSNSSSDWSDNSEIWLFKADNLAAGPQYRLSSGELNFGFTLHTTWLQEAAEVPTRNYDVARDFEESVEECKKFYSESMGQEIDSLFEQVYQEFNNDRKSS